MGDGTRKKAWLYWPKFSPLLSRRMRSKYNALSIFQANYPLKQFFSTATKRTPINFIALKRRPVAHKVNELFQHQEKMVELMRRKYAKVMEGTFKPGQFVYRLCGLSPEEMITGGGFKTNANLYVSNTGSGMNEGANCFTLLPSVATLFSVNVPREVKCFIYACMIQGNFFAPGGQFRQVIIPGALPMPSVWMAREVMAITENRTMVLGPMVGHGAKIEEAVLDDSFTKFSQPYLEMPTIISHGDEHTPMEIDIIDTEASKQFQEEVEAYYTLNPPSACHL